MDVVKSIIVGTLSNVAEMERDEKKYKDLSDKELIDKLKSNSETSKQVAKRELESRGRK